MKKYITIIVFCLFSLVSYSQVIDPLKWGMTQEEVTATMKDNNCYLDTINSTCLVTHDIVAYCKYQVDYVYFQFNQNYKYGLTSIGIIKEVNTLKEALNLRDEWVEHFSSSYQKFRTINKYIAYDIFDIINDYIGFIGIQKIYDDGNKYLVIFTNTYR